MTKMSIQNAKVPKANNDNASSKRITLVGLLNVHSNCFNILLILTYVRITELETPRTSLTLSVVLFFLF